MTIRRSCWWGRTRPRRPGRCSSCTGASTPRRSSPTPARAALVQIRLQRLPCPEGLLRQRAREPRPLIRRQRARGHGATLPRSPAEHLARVPAPRLRLRRLLPAQGPAGVVPPCRAGPRSTWTSSRRSSPRTSPTCAGRCRWCRETGATQTRDRRSELQGRHRRPAREPPGDAGRDPPGPRFRHEDLRPRRDDQPVAWPEPGLCRSPPAPPRGRCWSRSPRSCTRMPRSSSWGPTWRMISTGG